MKVLLISSGCGEWPNKGWGAVENLTADFCWALQEQEGIEASVLHSSKLREDLQEKILSWQPDIIHCEFDDHVNELQYVLSNFPNIKVLLTTHYAFLSQPYKLVSDGYMHRFLAASELVKSSGLILAPLSHEIATVYKDLGGVPFENMWVFPNGTRTDKIRFADAAQVRWPKKAVYLGKIEDRKNQYLLQNIENIDFIGPITDGRFQSNRKNYKGEWTRSQLYEGLTDYACLVLMSKAEAHPLVIGEALAAGCSILCSSVSSANLPKNVPWIRILSAKEEAEFLRDKVGAWSLVSEMCRIGMEHRSKIRGWAEKTIDWRIRAKEYIQKWCPLPPLSKEVEAAPSVSLPLPLPLPLPSTEHLRIALIGPGIMAIPPQGWGAVEQLIWDYSEVLKKLGHTVDIINTPNRSEIVAKVAHGSYDVAHVHYDVFWDILKELREHVKLVCITSHYPYVDKQEKWRQDGYDKVFEGICSTIKNSTNIKLFALSQKDLDMYLKAGDVHTSNVFIMPNGVNTDSFRITETPQFQKRSVILAKVESRKRQHLTFQLGQVDYIGRGPCDHPNYRGEIQPRTLLQNILTDWGTFVLLSDGENGTPLVVKEAMAAGLGCVLSSSAAYELPPNLGWVHVIPEEDVQNPQKINDAIEMNRSLSLPMRKQIREWVRTNWDWVPLIAQYVVNVKSCLEKCC